MKTLYQFLLEAKAEEPEEPEDRDSHLGWNDGDVEFHDGKEDDSQLKEDRKSKVTHEELGTKVHAGSIEDADVHTVDDHKEFIRAHSSLTPNQRKAIAGYKTSSHTTNSLLRKKVQRKDWDHFYGKKHLDQIKHLESALDGSRLHRDMHVYRGFSGALPMGKLKPGMKVTDHGFTGTTHKKSVASAFAKTHSAKVGKENHTVISMAKIHLPKGTKALHLDAKTATHKHKNEAETLIHRGTTYRVTHHTFHRDDTNMTHYHIVHMTVDSQN